MSLTPLPTVRKLKLTTTLGPSANGTFYTIDQKLGQGKFGTVYKAYPLANARQLFLEFLPPVALKLYTNDFVRSTLKNEAEKLKRTASCHHVVKYIDRSLPEEPLEFLVVEYVPETLADRIRIDPQTEYNGITQEIVVQYLRQIPKILSVLHQEQIAHLDLKPQNIGLKDDTLKIFDFGMSRKLGQDFTGPFAEPSSYYPPELRFQGKVTESCDTYCAEKVLESMLIGGYTDTTERAIDLIESIHDITLPASFRMLMLAMTARATERPHPESVEVLAQQAIFNLQKTNLFQPQKFTLLSDARFFPESSSLMA